MDVFHFYSSKKSVLALILAISVLLVNSQDAKATQYVFSDLGTVQGDLAGFGVNAYAINNHGQVVGNDSTTAYTWINGIASTLPSLTGADLTSAQAINDAGQVIGGDYHIAIDRGYPLRWDGQTLTSLSTLDGYISSAIAINNAGQIGGASWLSTSFMPVRWDGDAITPLETLGGNSGAVGGINEAGLLVGQSAIVDDEANHATLWLGTAATDLGTAGGSGSTAIDINNLNQIVGWGNVLGDQHSHALLWDGLNANPQDLGTLGSVNLNSAAQAINDDGTIIGWSELEGGEMHAVSWSNGLTLTDLNQFLPDDLGQDGWYLQLALGVNNRGDIVGILANRNNADLTAAFELKAVPLPGAVWLFGSVLAGFCAHKRQKALGV